VPQGSDEEEDAEKGEGGRGALLYLLTLTGRTIARNACVRLPDLIQLPTEAHARCDALIIQIMCSWRAPS
jgi:hypothetical protein